MVEESYASMVQLDEQNDDARARWNDSFLLSDRFAASGFFIERYL